MKNLRYVVGAGASAIGLAAAGMAALALTSAPDAPGVADIQFGERGSQARIAVICDTPCMAIKRTATEFVLRGASARLSLDLSARSQFLGGVSALPDGANASAISISVRYPVEYANTKSCTVAGRAAACIDLFFAEVSGANAPNEAARQTPVSIKETAPRSPAPAENTPPPSAAAALSAPPPLRETATERYDRFAALAPPERLAPPPQLAKLQPAPETLREIARRDEQAALVPQQQQLAPFSFADRAEWILGKPFNDTTCAEARSTLQNDPWALDAMVDVGFCAAADGDLEGADDILSRLLEYTPDNYAANVGRALIATEAGEKGVARNYFQRALNALPPIDESNRIVQAMNAL